jgi:hypothetical protein
MPGSRGTENRQRTVSFPVRLRPDEAEAIREKARDAGVSLSHFMRDAALGRRTRSTLDSQIINELRRLGGLLKHQFTLSGGQYSRESAAVMVEIKEAVARIGHEGDSSTEAE